MDFRKFAARCAAQVSSRPSGRLSATLVALAAVMLVTTFATAQSTQAGYNRHETNASREARIQRTIRDTYSHRWEVFGGGAYLRFRSGEYTQRNNEVTWNTQANYFLNPKFAIVGDARGMFGNGKPLRNQYISSNPNPQINEYAFTGGLGYRFYATERVALGAQALGGVAMGIFSGASKGYNYNQTGFWQDANRPAFVVNFNADFNFYPNLALRVSPTYVGTTFTSPSGGSLQSNVGINVGVLYRFGRQ